MLEEWADCMHFALSLFIQEEIEEDISEYCSYLETYEIIERCFNLYFVLENTLALGLKLGYTLEELEQAYWKKNKINWERIEGGY